MNRATMRQYRMFMQDVPSKFSPEEVDYREAEGKERCGSCFHFYVHKIDSKGACEIMHGENVLPDWVCNFFTKDGSDFPLLVEGEQRFDWKR